MSYAYYPQATPKRSNLPIVVLALFAGYLLADSGIDPSKPWSKYRAETDFNSGYKALARGDDLLAIALFERGLEKHPENTHAQKQLNFLLTKYRNSGASTYELNALEAAAPASGKNTTSTSPQITAPVPREQPSFVTATSNTPLDRIDLGTPNGTFLKESENKIDYRELQQRLLAERAYNEQRPSVYKPSTTYKGHVARQDVKVGSTAYKLNEQGYTALREGREAEAIAAFENSIRSNGDQSLIHRQLGYLYKSRGDDKKAVKSFQKALKIGGIDKETEEQVEKEVESLGDRWKFRVSEVFRANQFNPFDTVIAGESLAQSQTAIQLDYRPHLPAPFNAHHLTVYGRAFAAQVPGRFEVDYSTAQTGIGVKGKPIPSQNLFLSAERLIAAGIFSRNDWLLRASWSHGSGYTQPKGKSSWFDWSVYADAAVINPTDPDLFATGRAQFGKSWQIGPDGFQTFIRPFVNLSAVYQDAASVTTTLVEAGPGVELSFDLDGSRFFLFPQQVNIGTEYRQRIAGNSFSPPSSFLLYLNVDF